MLSFLCYTWQFTPGLLSGKSHGQRSLVGYSPWGRKESDKTERLHSLTHVHMGPPRWCSGKEPAWQSSRLQRHGFDPWVRKIPWRRAWQPTPVFLHGESHGQSRVTGYSPWGHRESETTEHILSFIMRGLWKKFGHSFVRLNSIHERVQNPGCLSPES